MIKPTTSVYRKNVLQGFAIPAIIHNNSYFFVDLDVYEDGRVSCWKLEDFDSFKKDVERGWVSVGIPDGESISIHGLGDWVIGNGKWLFDKTTFVAYVTDLLKELNPFMENLYHYRQKLVNGIRVSEFGDGTPFKWDASNSNSYFPDRVRGDSVNIFYATDDVFNLVKLNVFTDDTLELSRLPQPVALTMAELERLVATKRVVTRLPAGATVSIYGLGTFSATKAHFVTAAKDKLKEIKDIRHKLLGGLTSLETCCAAYEAYLASPTAAHRAQLKTAYEAVPDHQKMFVGDMDTKDTAVRMIVYGEQEIENWSHYAVAKATGSPLPGIDLPTPLDPDDEPAAPR